MIARLLLVLALCAGGADARTTNLRRLDGKSAKVGKSVTTTTSTVAASTTVATKSSKSEGSKSSKSVTTTTTTSTTTSTAPPGVTLTIDPPGRTGDTRVEYSFDFTANNVPAGVDNVIFEWTFSTGIDGTGSVTEAVAGGSASTRQSETYTAESTYALIVVLKDASNDEELATETVLVQIGDPVIREPELRTCDDWTRAAQGGQGTTVDNWDISAISDGQLFDIRFDAQFEPDRFIIEYPLGTIALDTGWRGSSAFDGNPVYPGGVTEQTEFPGENRGYGEEFGVATRISGEDLLKVTVIGPSSTTVWNYEIRCRDPNAPANIEPESGARPFADAPQEVTDDREDIVDIEGAVTAEIAEMAVGSKSSKAHSFSMSLPSKSGKGSKALSLSMPSKSGKGEAI